MKDQDVYFKKIIPFNFRKQSLRFRTSQELFSSHDIDLGTRFLLRTVLEAGYPRPQRILDAGCGYGPLGLTLKKLYPDSLVHLFDRDALAVEYTRQNSELNGIPDVEVYGSLGYDDVKRNDFDLILSNIPGKAGEKVIRYLLEDAACYLSPGGIVAVVIVEPLEGLVASVLEESPDIEILLRRKRPGHTVFHYRFTRRPPEDTPCPGALERGIYLRNRMQVRVGNLEFNMQTAIGLPEFDSLDYRSEMLIRSLEGWQNSRFHRTGCYNPGQGHVAVAIWKLFQPQLIELVDRDLLALRYTGLNLTSNGCPEESLHISHQTGFDIQLSEPLDLIAGVLREEEGTAAINLTVSQAAERLGPGGKMLISSSSTAATRLAGFIKSSGLLRLQGREKWKGNSLLILEHG